MHGITAGLFAMDWASLALPGISLLEKILRPILVYAFLVLALRVAGKRELGQLSSFDFVVLLLISNTVQNAVIGPDNSILGGVIGAATLLGVNYLVVRFFFRHPGLDAAFEGRPDALISGGVVNEERLKRELITRPELEEAARKQGIEDLAEVERAELETDGNLLFTRKAASVEEARQAEILGRLAALAAEVEALRAELSSRDSRARDSRDGR